MQVSQRMSILTLTILCIYLSTVQAHYVDLTYKLDINKMTVYPIYNTSEYLYKLDPSRRGPWGNYTKWMAFNTFSMAEHTGTHLDAPFHFSEKGKKLDDLTLEDLHGPLVRIDTSDKVKSNPNSGVDVSDLEAWEAKYGRIPDNAYIVNYSGWGKYYGTHKYLYNKKGELEYPGFTGEAAEWLLKNRPNFRGVASDTISCDLHVDPLPVHDQILPAGKLCVENLAHTDKLPDEGAHLVLMPLYIAGGTGSPIRAFAVWGVDFSLIGGSGYMSLNIKLITWLVALCIIITH